MFLQKYNKQINNFFPIIAILKNYNKEDLNGDVFAGMVTAILLIPQGIAYAILAGLPPQMGLYASILPPIIYAILGTSRALSVGPVSIAAIMIASALSAPEITKLGSSVENAIILAAEGGLVLLLMATLRMGRLVNFISHPVLTGFTSGAAILIIFTQIPSLLGLTNTKCDLDLACVGNYLQDINIYTVGLAIFCIAILLSFSSLLKSFLSKFNIEESVIVGVSRSAPLLIVVITAVFVQFFQLDSSQDVAIVGEFDAGLPTISFSFFSNIAQWQALLPSAIFIAIIAYVESVAIAKVTANIRNQKINPNQELVALGASNIVTAFSGGMSVAGGFSRTMVHFTSGARTQLAMVVAVIILSIVIIFFAQQFAYIPKVALAAIILIAILPLIKLRRIITVWKYSKTDGIAELLTLLGVLVLGIEEGIVLGIAITIMGYLRQASRPHIAIVGKIKDTNHFRNVARHDVETWNNVTLIRIDENITFANASYIIDFIENETLDKPKLKHVVLIFSSVSHVDVTAFEAIEKLITALKNKGISLNLSEVKGPVLDKLERNNFSNHLKPGAIFFQTITAVEKLAN